MLKGAPELAAALLGWAQLHGRTELPWRKERSAYGTWISEVMLQQTRVETVRDRYVEWLVRFPDVAALAAASEEEVLAAWAGLGYYRRARFLHRGARRVMESGELPVDARGWLQLPGVGDYTAGAIAAQTVGESGAVVDGNVERVLARVHGIRQNARRGEGRRKVRAAAAALLGAAPAGAVLEALMDLGATLCKPRAPQCDRCPWADNCRARAAGDPEALPVLPERRALESVFRVHVALESEGRYWLRPATAGEYGEGMWIFPTAGFVADEPAMSDARAVLKREGLVTAGTPRAVGRIRASITHHRVTGLVFLAKLAVEPGGSYRSFAPEALAGAALAKPDVRILALLEKSRPG